MKVLGAPLASPASLALLMNSGPVRDTALKDLDGISENDT